MNYKIRKGNPPIIEFAGGGCRPASDVEMELIAEIERLKEELENIKERDSKEVNIKAGNTTTR